MKKRFSVLLCSCIFVLGLLVAGFVALSSRNRFPAPAAVSVPPFPYEEMRPGDLVFRTGTGLYSQMLRVQHGDTVYYSHVGLLALRDSQWMVVHAVPHETEGPEDFERVKLDPLDSFFSPRRALHGEFVHTGIDVPPRLLDAAVQFACDSVRFDANFDLEDSTRLYCTELIWRLWRREGVDLTEGRRSYRGMMTLGPQGCIAPQDILQYHGNVSYFQY